MLHWSLQSSWWQPHLAGRQFLMSGQLIGVTTMSLTMSMLAVVTIPDNFHQKSTTFGSSTKSSGICMA